MKDRAAYQVAGRHPAPGSAIFVGLILSLGLICSAVWGEVAAPEPTTSTRIELLIEPHVDLYFYVRSQASRDGAADPGYEAAVAAAREVQEMLGAWGGWGPVDSWVLMGDLEAAEAAFAEIEEPYQRHGREISLRDDAVAFAAALRKVEAYFLENAWPARRARLEAALAQLGERFLPKHRQALAHMMESLAIEDPKLEAPMHLVVDSHPPGASTYYLVGGKPASVLSIAELEGALLEETVLHEATHVLDMASRDSGSVFVSLREMLVERRMERRDRRMRGIPHTLMFVQAAATMRRIYDPEHHPYGESSGVYERAGQIAEVEIEVWQRHLDGKIGRKDALQAIVDGILGPIKDGEKPGE